MAGVGLDYETWRSLAFAFVKVEAARWGWRVRRVHEARSGTWYVKLEHGCGLRAGVRLSDHRQRFGVASLLCLHVRQASTGRLRYLGDWLCGLLLLLPDHRRRSEAGPSERRANVRRPGVRGGLRGGL